MRACAMASSRSSRSIISICRQISRPPAGSRRRRWRHTFVTRASASATSVRVCARHWLTLKDPVTEVTQGYLTGLFPPGQKLALGRAVLALHKMLTAHAQAVLLYKSMELGGSIGIAHRAEGVYPLTQRAEDVLAAWRDDVLMNGCDKRYGLFYVDYETGERTPKKSADWFGDLAHSRLMLTTSSVSNGLLI